MHAESMAVQQYAGQLVHLPEEVTEPLADFLTSGLQQVERVFKGPRPRMEVIIYASFPPMPNYHWDNVSNHDLCEKWGLEGAAATANGGDN